MIAIFPQEGGYATSPEPVVRKTMILPKSDVLKTYQDVISLIWLIFFGKYYGFFLLANNPRNKTTILWGKSYNFSW